jgi:hypothetical protein
MNAKVLSGFISILRSIGRWIVEHLAQKGLNLLIGYMDGKIGDFQRRRDRPLVAKWRVKWLNGRIARWTAAIKWLRAHSSACTQAAAKALIEKNADVAKCPVVGIGEHIKRLNPSGYKKKAKKKSGKKKTVRKAA